MKEQLKSAILPPLPIVGALRLTTIDGKSLSSIDVTTKKSDLIPDPFFRDCFEKLADYLNGHSKKIDIKLDFSSLSPFQIKVMKAIHSIPYGRVATYKDLAMKMDSRAYQAIGSACGRNPFMLIYPCHRVVGSQDLGGFAHGLPMKKKLLQLEGIQL